MTRSEVLDTAKKCVCGQREQDYGSPESNFQIIADLWNAYLFRDEKFPPDQAVRLKITPTDVAMMMALLKIARIKNGGGTGDSFVDLAGYAACGGELNDISNKEEHEFFYDGKEVKSCCKKCIHKNTEYCDHCCRGTDGGCSDDFWEAKDDR